MYILICNYGNCDSGDAGCMLVGTFASLESAQKAMREDMERSKEDMGFCSDNEFPDEAVSVHEFGAHLMDGGFYDHERWEVWTIFDSDKPGESVWL